jgi:hypothetical protein
MAIKIQNSTIIDDSRNIVNAGLATFTGNVSFGSSAYFNSGNGIFFGNEDFKIFHDGSHSIIQDQGIGNLYILASNQLALQSNSSQNYFIGNAGGAVELYNANVKKFETSSSGGFIYGGIAAGPSGYGFTYCLMGADNGRNIEIGVGSTNLPTYVDFLGSLSYTDYAARFIRNPGDSGNFDIINRGTGNLNLTTQDFGGIQFSTQNTFRHRIDPYGTVLIGTATSTGTENQTVQVSGNAYVSGSIGIGITNPTSKLTVQGDVSITGVTTTGTLNVGVIAGTAFESYELDDMSLLTDGIENTFIPKLNYEKVTITNPFNLLITVNGVLQSTFINNTDYVFQSNFLGSNNGYTLDSDNNIKFTESVPSGSDIIARVIPSATTPTRIRYYPFKPTDILLGY